MRCERTVGQRVAGTIAPLAVASLLCACTVGPDYSPPKIETPAAFSTAATSNPSRFPAWWHGFGDPLLDQLVAEAMAANLDIRQAALRVDEARRQVRIAGAAGKPALGADADASVTRLSRNSTIGGLLSKGLSGGGGGVPPDAGLPGTTVRTLEAGFDASWEIDLFGGVRRSVEAANARLDAAGFDAADARVMLAAEVARDYLGYRTLQGRIGLLDQTLDARRDALALDHSRQANGLTTIVDLRRSERDIAGIEAQRQDLQGQLAAQGHALAGLLARPPLDLEARLSRPAADPATVVPPVGLPSDLLERRPDIRAAERRLAAANAEIGVATADLYPKIDLTGSVDLVSSSLRTLIEAESLQPSAAAALTAPLLDGRRRRATVDLRRVQAQEAELAWRATVLGALRDVEDALSRLQADRGRLAQLAASEAAARDALEVVQAQRRAGLNTGLDLVEARTTLLSAGDAVVQARFAVSQDVVGLYKALGGGWDQTAAHAGKGG